MGVSGQSSLSGAILKKKEMFDPRIEDDPESTSQRKAHTATRQSHMAPCFHATCPWGEPQGPALALSPIAAYRRSRLYTSERLARHARARIPNDVRVREADYFDGSRAPESQGQKGSELATTENPKGEQTNLITKRACLIAKRACAEPDAHFVES